MPTLQYHPVVAGDGRWIQLANLLEHHFHAYISAIGLSEIYADPRFVNAPTGLTPETRRALSDLMLERMQDRSLEEWMELFQADGQIASEPVQSAQEGLLHPDLDANGEVVAFDHPRHGPVRQLGPIAQLSETPGEPPQWFAEPGEHTQELLAEPPREPWQPANGATPSDRPPLEGVTIIEFGTIIAAPLGITFLADLGARVIKVEAPEGDPYRGMGYGLGSFCGIAKTSAGKESICIDLKREEGRAVVRRLLEQADAVMHNFRPGVPERLGIGYEQVRAIRPDVVYLQVNGYGPKGPSAARPSAHPIPGAATGGQLYQAGAAMPPPEVGSIPDASEAARWLYRANEGNPDPNTGCVVQNAMMLGLYARKKFGIGQLVSMSMLGANAYANSDDFLSYEGKAPRPTVDADLHGINALYRLYPPARAGSSSASSRTASGRRSARPPAAPTSPRTRASRPPRREASTTWRSARSCAASSRSVPPSSGSSCSRRSASAACRRTADRRASSSPTTRRSKRTAGISRPNTPSGAATGGTARR